MKKSSPSSVLQCGSGDESGWTFYLNEPSGFCSGQSGGGHDSLSLVSDASSGPPHFDEGRSRRSGEEEEYEYALFWREGVIGSGRGQREEDSCLQDTASSTKKKASLARDAASESVLLQKGRRNGQDNSRHHHLRSSESTSRSKGSQ